MDFSKMFLKILLKRFLKVEVNHFLEEAQAARQFREWRLDGFLDLDESESSGDRRSLLLSEDCIEARQLLGDCRYV